MILYVTMYKLCRWVSSSAKDLLQCTVVWLRISKLSRVKLGTLCPINSGTWLISSNKVPSSTSGAMYRAKSWHPEQKNGVEVSAFQFYMDSLLEKIMLCYGA